MTLLKNFQTSLSIAAPETDTTSTLLFTIPGSSILKPYLIIHNYTVIIILLSGINMLHDKLLGYSAFHLI